MVTKSANNIGERLCTECGIIFQGGPNAQRCPDCRAAKKKAQRFTKPKNRYQHDLENKKFGRLTALRLLGTKTRPNGKKVPVWECLCECGRLTNVARPDLISGRVKSCGCLHIGKESATSKKIEGKKFTRLTPLYPVGSDRRGIIWRCVCDCGNIVDVSAGQLTAGHKRSCGCLRHETAVGKDIASKLNPYQIDGTNVLMLNDKPYSTNTSGVRGVWWNGKRGKWVAEIMFKYKKYNLGYYDDIADATKARKEAEARIWGDFLDWYITEHGEE